MFRNHRPEGTFAFCSPSVRARSPEEDAAAECAEVEAATDAQERSRAVASNLVAIASEVDSRAPLKALARLETSMQSQLAASASGASSGPILHAKRITAQPESALMPTHCLSCQQPLPTYSHYSPPHETAYLPAGLSLSPGRAASSGRRTPTRG